MTMNKTIIFKTKDAGYITIQTRKRKKFKAMNKLGFIVFIMGIMFFISAMMVDTFDNILLNFDYLIEVLTNKEYFLSNIVGTFRVFLWFFMMWLGFAIATLGLLMMKLIRWR